MTGKCKICGRSNLVIVAYGACGACYPVVVRMFNGDVKKAIAYRKTHPVRSKKVINGTPTSPNRAIFPPPSKSKTWLDMQIEDAIGRVTELVKQSGSRAVSLEVDVEITIKNVRIKQ